MAAKQKKQTAAKQKKQTRRLALVVHGLGEQGPGETLDDLAGGLWGGEDNLSVGSDAWLMQDIDQPNPRKLQTFPCHVRRYADPKTPHKPHTTFAEVYWADISGADKGAFRIFYGLIKAILGLGHIVRAGAQQYFGKGDTWSSRCANFIPYLLHGPVAGVNAALATGVLFLFAATKLFAETDDKQQADIALPEFGICLALLLAGLLLCGVGDLWRRKIDVYYFRIFSVWLIIYGALMAALAVLQFFGWGDGATGGAIKEFIVQALLGADVTSDEVKHFSSGYLWFGVVLLLCLKLAWLLMIATLIILVGATVVRLVRNKNAGSGAGALWRIPPLHLIIPCAMLWLWMLVIATIWVTVYNTGNFQQIDEELLNVGVRQLLAAMMGLGLVTIGVAVTLVGRWRWGKYFKNPQPDINTVFAAHPVPRLLLSRGIVAGLMLTGLLFSAAAIFFALQDFGLVIGPALLQDIDEDYLPYAIAAAVVIGGFAFAQRDGIAQALGVGKDLITYFKVEPTERGKAPGKGERMGVFSMPANYTFTEFRQRERIHGRMQKVLMALWQSGEFDELIVITHSQGTIIATEFAKELQKNRGSLIPKAARDTLGPVMKEATLVTMGSPFTHVYNYYLPGKFGAPGTIKKGVMIKKWINIFRIDDFIGTYIGNVSLKGTWPKNHAVPAGGHTGYWKDDDVIRHLQPLFAHA